MVIRRVGQKLETDVLEPCVFVPLIGRFGFQRSFGPRAADRRVAVDPRATTTVTKPSRQDSRR